MTISSLPALVDALRQSRLLEPAQLDEVNQTLLARFPDPRALAKELFRRGWLTPYQGNQLFQGRGHELILGQYLLLEKVGEGGMGQVFKARHQGLGRVVALKVIRKDRLAKPEAVRRFHREIQLAAQLNHPNIVLAFDAGEVGGTHCFAMEYVEGKDLLRLLKQSGPLPMAQACDCIRQAALGLQHALERGMVHRDIKPSNLMLAPKGNVIKILDMGLARLDQTEGDDESSALTQEGSVMGTIDYVAPEQAMNSHLVDIRGDLYSLGCTFYQLLTGRVPFPGGTAMEKLSKHRWEEPAPVEQLRPEVSPGVAAVVHKLMAKLPEDRFQTPAELAVALEPAVLAAGAVRSDTVKGPGPSAPGAAQQDRKTGIRPDPAPTDSVDPRKRQASILVAVVIFLAKAGWQRPKLLLSGVGGACLLGVVVLLALLLSGRGRGPSPGTGTGPQSKGPLPLDQLDPAKIPPEKRFAGQPKELVAVLGETRGRHWGAGPVRSLVFSPNGRALASLGSDYERVLRLWDPTTMRELAVFKDSSLIAMAFTADGKTLVLPSVGGIVKLWDVAATRELKSKKFPAGNLFRVLAVAPDGKTVAVSVSDPVKKAGLQVWNLDKDQVQPIFWFTGDVRFSAQYSPDGKTVAALITDRQDSKRNSIVKVADVNREGDRQLKGLTGQVFALAFAPGGKTLATMSQDESKARTVKLWNADTGEELLALPDPLGNAFSFVFAPDGKTLALVSGSGGTVNLWDVDKKQLRKAITSPQSVSTVVFAPDSKTFAAFHHNASESTPVKLWDTATGAERSSLQGAPSGTYSLAFSPDGKTAAMGSWDHVVRLWDVATGKERFPGPGVPVTSLAWDRESQTAAVVSRELDSGMRIVGTVKLWEPATGRERVLIKDRSGDINCMAYAPDGKTVATGSKGLQAGQTVGVVILWDAATGKELKTLRGHVGQAISSVAFSPDGQMVAGASYERDEKGTLGVIKVWAVASGDEQTTLKGHQYTVSSLVYAPNGKTLASLDTGGILKIWDLATRKEQWLPLVQGITTGASALAFSLDGKTVATGTGAGAVTLWEAATGKLIATLQKQREGERVLSLAFSPGSETLAVAGQDGRVVFYQLGSGKKLSEWELPGAVNRLVFAPDGRNLFTGNGNGSVYVFRLAPPLVLSRK